MKKLAHFDTNGVIYNKIKMVSSFEGLNSQWKPDFWKISELINLADIIAATTISFSKDNHINMEMKYTLSIILSSENNWYKKKIYLYIHSIKAIISYINHLSEKLPSLLVLSEENKLNNLLNFLRGENFSKTSQEFTKTLLIKIMNKLLVVYDDREEYVKDIWDTRKLGITNNSIVKINIINFKEIHPLWLKNSIKMYIKHNLHNLTSSSVVSMISAIKKLSNFLMNNYPTILSKNLSRKIISFHLLELQKFYTQHSLHSIASSYKVFFEFMHFKDNKNFPKLLLLKEDVPRKPKSAPRYIPDYVMIQLENNLEKLPSDIFRLMKIGLETGIRRSDLLQLKTLSVQTDEEGGSYLKYFQGKTKKDHIIPISKELAGFIAAQEEVVKNKYGEERYYLFPNSKGKPYNAELIINKINKLCIDNEIKYEDGSFYKFKIHDMRHTVGTNMINSGVPQHIVKNFLGHTDSMTTSIYARLLNKTLKKEILPKNNVLINIEGNIEIKGTTQKIIPKELIYHQVLPNGYCSLSLDQSCPHSNACLTCTHFRTDHNFLSTHLKQIEETKLIIQKAKDNKWERHEQANKDVLSNLKKIVSKLSEIR